MIKCNSCGLELDDDTKLCPNCGNNLEGSEKVQEPNEETSKKCPNCGALVAEEAFICPECGEKIAEIKMSKKCPNCGSELDIDSQFCDSCGFSLNSSSNSTENDSNEVKNETSLSEMFASINYVKLGVTTLIALILSFILTFIFMLLVEGVTSYGYIPDYGFAFYLALFVAVLFVATYLNNIVEGGILGLLTGLLLGLLESSIAGFLLGSSWGYEFVFGDNTFGFIIVGIFVGVLANMFLKEKFTKYVDLHKYV